MTETMEVLCRPASLSAENIPASLSALTRLNVTTCALDDLVESEVIVGDDSEDEFAFNGEVNENEEIYVTSEKSERGDGGEEREQGYHSPEYNMLIQLRDPDEFFCEEDEHVQLYTDMTQCMFGMSSHGRMLESVLEEDEGVESGEVDDDEEEEDDDDDKKENQDCAKTDAREEQVDVKEEKKEVRDTLLKGSEDTEVKGSEVTAKAQETSETNSRVSPSATRRKGASGATLANSVVKNNQGNKNTGSPARSIKGKSPPSQSKTPTARKETMKPKSVTKAGDKGEKMRPATTVSRVAEKQKASLIPSTTRPKTNVVKVSDKKVTTKTQVTKETEKKQKEKSKAEVKSSRGKGDVATRAEDKVGNVRSKIVDMKTDGNVTKKADSVPVPERTTKKTDPSSSTDKTWRTDTSKTAAKSSSETVMSYGTLGRRKKTEPSELKLSADKYGTLGRKSKDNKNTPKDSIPAEKKSQDSNNKSVKSSKGSVSRPTVGTPRKPTLICLEAGTQTVISAVEELPPTLGGVPEASSAVGPAEGAGGVAVLSVIRDVTTGGEAGVEKGVQADIMLYDPEDRTYTKHETAELVAKLKRMTDEHGQLEAEYARTRTALAEIESMKKELRQVYRLLEEERAEKVDVQTDLDKNVQRVHDMLESMEGVEREFNQRGDSLIELETKLGVSVQTVRKLQQENAANHDTINRLTQDVDRGVAAQKMLLQQVQESEAEFKEMQDFLQEEKNTLGEALRESENEMAGLRISLNTKDSQLRDKEEECSHLVRLAEQRRQEALILESELANIKTRTKDTLLRQGAEVSAVAVSLSDLTSRLDSLGRHTVATDRQAETTVSGTQKPVLHTSGYSSMVGEILATPPPSINGSDTLQNLANTIFVRQNSEGRNSPEGQECNGDDCRTEAGSAETTSLVDLVTEIDRHVTRLTSSFSEKPFRVDSVKATSQRETSNKLTNGDHRNDDDELHKLKDEVVALRRDLDDSRRANQRTQKHCSLYKDNLGKAEEEVKSLDEALDGVLETLISIPDIVSSNARLQQLWLELGGPRYVPKSARTNDSYHHTDQPTVNGDLNANDVRLPLTAVITNGSS